MNCENIIFDLALRYGGRFANINDFCKMVVKQYGLETYSDIVQLRNASGKKNLHSAKKDDALMTLIANDIKCFSTDSYDYILPNDFSAFIENHVKKVIGFYQTIGLNVAEDDIRVYFCNSFPKPFDKNKGIALAPDDYDEIKFGIKKGIYFLNSNISSYQSRLLVAHEILHHICSKRQPEFLARGLEEGLCELIGSYITNAALFEKPIPQNYIKFRRFKYANPNQKFRIYTDYMRLAFLLLKQVGLDGVVSIINSGRHRIKLVETALLHGEDIHSFCSSFSTLSDDLSNELDRLLLGTIENEVLSPLAHFIINNYAGERTVSMFAKANGFDPAVCVAAFEEIQSRVYGCVIDCDSIEFSDLEQLKNNGNILYECTAI